MTIIDVIRGKHRAEVDSAREPSRVVLDNRAQLAGALADAKAAVLGAVAPSEQVAPDAHRQTLIHLCTALAVPVPDTPAGAPIRTLLRTAGIRFRTVRADTESVRHTLVPLVVFHDSGRPEAVLPGTSHRPDRLLQPGALAIAPILPAGAGAAALLRFVVAGSRRDLFALLAAGLAFGLLSVLIPASVSLIVPKLLAAGDGSIWWTAALLATAVTVAGLMLLVRNAASSRIQSRVRARLEPAIWDRMLRQEASFFRQYSTGEMVQRGNGISQVQQMLSEVLVGAALTVLFSLGGIVLIVIVSPLLGAVVLVSISIIGAVVLLLARGQEQHETAVYEAYGEVFGLLYTLLRGIDKIHAAGREIQAFARWAGVFRRQKLADAAAMNVQARTTAVIATTQPLLVAALLAAVAVGGFAVTTTGLLLAVTAVGQVALGLGQLGHLAASAYATGPILRRLQPILADPEKVGGDVEPGRLSGEITMQGVSFRYPGAVLPTLSSIDLHAAPGEMIAVVGSSGAGKSTLIRLLLGFVQPESGEVRYDGLKLTEADVSAVRRQIGSVLQNGKMLRGNLFDNIAGPESDLPEERIWESADLAGIGEELRQLPMGLQTRISESADGLSGGQIQRILIARALVRRPPILLLDEATSALDNRTQALVAARLAALPCTRVVIAHRLSTIRGADRIYVLDRGAVAGVGTFDQLAQNCEQFRRLIGNQVL